MLPIDLQTPRDILKGLAERVRAHRVARGWTQEELARRSGVVPRTYREFEATGQISLERLVKIATVLDEIAGFDQLFRMPAAATLEDIEERATKPPRKRARRRAQG